MPRIKEVGQTILNKYPKHNYKETHVTFEDILNNPKLKDDVLLKPNYQGALIEDKYMEIVEEYLCNKSLLASKNKVVIGCLNDKWYVIDGQHRLEACKILKRDYNKDDCLVFCWYQLFTEDRMKELFNSLNKDSIKNKFYIDKDDFKVTFVLDFKQKIIEYVKSKNVSFAPKQTATSKIKCIEEFIEKLREGGFFDKFNNVMDAYNTIINKNNLFFEKSNLISDYKNNSSVFYKTEIQYIENGIIFPLKHNNFMEFIFNEDINVYHTKKAIKIKITPYKKKKVWKNEYDDSTQAICPISFCNEILHTGKNGWQCGHIVSEHNGGSTEPHNLRPICAGCNQSMGIQNWNNYDTNTISSTNK
jgi:hypothetical protein